MNNCKSIGKFKTIVPSILLILLVFQFTSCKKYLDEKRSNLLNSPSTIDDLQALLDDAIKLNNNVTPARGEASSDDYFVQQTIYTGLAPQFQHLYTWRPYDYNWQNDWSYGYTPVYPANYSLEQLENIPVTPQNQTQWNNVKGSALFFRAYSFLMLTWNYAKAFDVNTSNSELGIALRLSSNFNIPSTRATVKECYDRIILDAKEAASYLPNTPSHVYRPSKPAAYGLLARAYLSMRNYDSAFRYADMCLNIKNSLLDYNVFPANPSSTPFSVYKLNLNPEIIFYTEMNTTMPMLASTRARVDTALYLTYASNDRRRSVFFANISGSTFKSFKGSYTGVSTVPYFSGIAVDEVFLIRAECKARGINGNAGDKDGALADLNILLSKRYNNTFVPVATNTATEALDRILLERRKELFFRGLRWIDIKRLNKEGRNIILQRIISGQTYFLQPNANYFALPLPTDIINLTDMPQNPF